VCMLWQQHDLWRSRGGAVHIAFHLVLISDRGNPSFLHDRGNPLIVAILQLILFVYFLICLTGLMLMMLMDG
jgi:hypothetical protein